MESMKGTTRGLDLYDRVSECLERLNLPWTKLLNVTTDGCPNLTWKNVGLLRRIQDRVREDDPNTDLIFLHCIFHQESLCKTVLKLDHVAEPVVKLVNFIWAHGFNHRQFVQLLDDTDAEYTDFLYHSNVRWLSLGEEIETFLVMVGKVDEFAELKDQDWVCHLAFSVDVLGHLNELNLKLQGKNVFVHKLYSFVRAFKAKLVLFSQKLTHKCFTHFPTLASLEVPPHHNKTPPH
ncbi:general transcription factor II-I repeat domain-containing protein 2-like [Myxocyprinus asiaticus]|uniref:general transcription factor II-I repeat domain-containing protein 2-like n=1 Tax=Myxocyprinus asiaticus TaxID=70543 RepID=UPI002223DBB4|nr:general transcription factor II-I repeat domain-containing protein 2-like [Myxocyprinus asiaticus]